MATTLPPPVAHVGEAASPIAAQARADAADAAEYFSAFVAEFARMVVPALEAQGISLGTGEAAARAAMDLAMAMVGENGAAWRAHRRPNTVHDNV